MRNKRTKFWISIILPSIILIGLFATFTHLKNRTPAEPLSKQIHATSFPQTSIETKRARLEYFFRLMRDPATDQIPPNIRLRELAYARTLPKVSQLHSMQATSPLFNWNEVGPVDVGGRTRALAVDVTNPNVIIAGGVSGGIWKSNDGGMTWVLKNDPTQVLSITSVAQDPRTGHTNKWYCASGEYFSSSPRDRGQRASFLGAGLYKSIDSGETWQLLHTSGSLINWDSPYDYVSRIVVSPTTGSIFFSSHVGGIYRSTDGGNTFALVHGGWAEHRYTDVVVASNGTLIAALSEYGFGDDPPTNSPGLYISTDDGINWTDITPTTFPTTHDRSVLASAPSNPKIVYVFTYTGEDIQTDTEGEDDDEEAPEDVRFHKINLSTGESEDRSANLPDFGSEYGRINTQNNYNMLVAVKPDNENFVVIGGTSLFRSKDGFKTASQDTYYTWIGGFDPKADVSFYPNQHPDQHAIAFDPTNPKKMWCGHDGGLSYASDITASSSSTNLFPWENKNNRYLTSQFYTVAIPDEANDERIMGGTQDNGTPFFRWERATTSLAPEESAYAKITYKVLQGDLPGPLENTATVSGTDSQGNSVTRSASASVTLSSSSALTLENTTNVSTANVGDTITYTFTVKNTGQTSISNIKLTDSKLGTITLDKTTLASNASAQGTATYKVVQGDMPGPLENTATVSGTDSGGKTIICSAIASVTLTTSSALTLEKISDVSTASAGDTITYFFSVKNTGQTSISNIKLTDSKLGTITLDKTTDSYYVTAADGAYGYFGDSFAYVSTQNGEISRVGYNEYGDPYNPWIDGIDWSFITPEGATDQLFINPLVVDPSNEDVMYYPAGQALWRNDQLTSIPKFENGTSQGWTELPDLAVPEGYVISTMAVSRTNPAHVFYYAASSRDDPPKIYRLENANTATSGAQDISIPGEGLDGAYVHCIAVHPDKANEIIVVLSNYNIVGLYHSTDGGKNYSAIEGNLEGDEVTPGPSLRSATILPTAQGTLYVVGTSTGVYSTNKIDGSKTVWALVAAAEIGNVVVEFVTSRKSDTRLFVGTHGRGIFVGTLASSKANRR